MIGNTPNVADQLRAEGWKQGCLISPDKTEQVTSASIDFFENGVCSNTWLVLLTQDCDLVRDANVEPYVELLAIQKLSNTPSNSV